MNRFVRRTWHVLRTGLIACTLAGVLVSASGVILLPPPLPVGDRPFPCQGHACGCSSAAQCWQACCCYSDVEKLAWAKQHDVQPPATLVERLANASLVGEPSESHACCSTPKVARSDRESATEGLARLVLLQNLSQCRGLSLYQAVFGVAVCQEWPEAWRPHLPASGWVTMVEGCWSSHQSAPGTPPPRRVG